MFYIKKMFAWIYPCEEKGEEMINNTENNDLESNLRPSYPVFYR